MSIHLPKAFRPRFTLRALLAAIAIGCLLLAREVRYYERRIDAIEQFERKFVRPRPGSDGVVDVYNWHVHFPPAALPSGVGAFMIRRLRPQPDAALLWGAGVHVDFIEFHDPRFTENDFHLLLAFPEITTLDLAGTSVTDAIGPLLVNFPKLTTIKLGAASYGDLKIEGPGIGDAIVKYLCALHSLERLDLNGTHITDAAVREIAKQLPTLKFLDISDTNVTGACYDDILDMPNLEEVYLDCERFPVYGGRWSARVRVTCIDNHPPVFPNARPQPVPATPVSP